MGPNHRGHLQSVTEGAFEIEMGAEDGSYEERASEYETDTEMQRETYG